MISASNFARHTSVWAQTTPTLEQVVRWANDKLISTGRAVPSGSDPQRHSLISETAFLLARHDQANDEPSLPDVESEAREFLSHLPRSDALTPALTHGEWSEINDIRDKIFSYTHWLPSVEFSPTVPGCGVVDQSIADIVAESELIEVKAVMRPIRSVDFRQMLTYVAMYYSKGRSFNKLTLLNPRNSYLFSVTLDDLASGSSGKSAVELLQELIEWMVGLQVSA